MTNLHKLELTAGVVTFLIAIYLMSLEPTAGIIYGLPATLTAYGAYRHATTRARWAHFMVGIGALGILGAFVFCLLILTFKRLDDPWTFLNFALAISGLVTVVVSVFTHFEAD